MCVVVPGLLHSRAQATNRAALHPLLVPRWPGFDQNVPFTSRATRYASTVPARQRRVPRAHNGVQRAGRTPIVVGRRGYVMDHDFEIDASTPGRLVLRGEFDTTAAVAFVTALGKEHIEEIVVDLAGVTFIDSSGLRAMLRARAQHQGTRFVNAPPAVRRVLDITGTASIILGDDTDPA
jgi:anti-sigma B factor antagonist